MPKVFPDPPTRYIEIERITKSKTFIIPEDGYFQIDVISKSGDGGKGIKYRSNNGDWYLGNGPSGGSGAVTRKSSIKLNKGEEIKVSISNSESTVHIPYANIELKVGAGINGTNRPENGSGAHGGNGGKVIKGGDLSYNGKNGTYSGNQVQDYGDLSGRTVLGEKGVSTNNLWYSIYSGDGGGFNKGTEVPPKKGSSAMVVIFRGNTNLTSSQQNTLNITSLMLEINKVGQEITDLKLNKSV